MQALWLKNSPEERNRTPAAQQGKDGVEKYPVAAPVGASDWRRPLPAEKPLSRAGQASTGIPAAFELSTCAAERFPNKLLTDANAAFHSGGDGGAFYLPCCWETLAVTAACDHCCGVLPHHPIGRTPAQSPSCGGIFSGCVRPKAHSA